MSFNRHLEGGSHQDQFNPPPPVSHGTHNYGCSPSVARLPVHHLSSPHTAPYPHLEATQPLLSLLTTFSAPLQP